MGPLQPWHSRLQPASTSFASTTLDRRATSWRSPTRSCAVGGPTAGTKRCPEVDHISLRRIRVFGRHGANPGEKNVPHPFDIDVELEVDLERAAHTDDLADTLDYAALHQVIGDIVSTKSYTLLE